MRDSYDGDIGGSGEAGGGARSDPESDGVKRGIGRAACVADLSGPFARIRGELEFADGVTASAMLTELDARVAELEGLRLLAIRRIDTSGVWGDDLNGTPNSFLRSRHVRDHGGAGRDLRAAKLVSDYAVVCEAVAGGLVSRAHLDVIVSVGQKNRARADALPGFLPMFIEIAANAPASDLRRVMRTWADHIDPVGSGDDEHDAHRRRYLNVSQLGDGIRLDGFFAPEAGMKICAVMNALLAELFRSGEGTDPDAGVRVSNSVQRADAMELAMDRMLANGGLPTTGGAPASVTVTVPISRLQEPCCDRVNTAELHEQLKNQLRHQFDEQVAKGATHGSVPDFGSILTDRSATIGVNNGPTTMLAPLQVAQRMSCDCTVQRILISPDGKPLDVGRSKRLFPAAIRKALEIRDRGCVFPGCTKPPSWTQAHHIIAWSQGGETSLANAALLCSNHHHQVHADRHTVAIGRIGKATVILNRRRQ